MPNSIRAILKKTLRKGAISQDEYDKVMRNVVEVRCRDCSHWQYDSVFKQGWCEGRERTADDYCSRPGRKEVKDGR